MARLFHAKGTRRRRLTAGVATLGAAAATMIALVTSGGVASATPVYSAYSVNVTGGGLVLNLFGNKLTGGNSSACANYGSPQLANLDGNGNATTCDTSKKGTPAMAWAQGEGTLLTSSGLHGLQTAVANAAGQTGTPTPASGKDGFVCSQLSTGGFQGSNGVGLDLGVACAQARASLDGTGNPAATATGEVVHVGVDLNGILSQIAGASPVSGSSDLCNQASGQNQQVGQLLNGVCQLLGSIGSGGGNSAPAPIGGLFDGVSQALQNLRDVATNDTVQCPLYTSTAAPAVVCVEVGAAKSTINTASDGTVTANSLGETVEVDVLPGVGCAPVWPAGTAKAGQATTLADCALADAANVTNEANNPLIAPLITVNVGPASCTETLDPTTAKWASSTYASLVDIHLNVPGDPITVPIPGAVGSGQTFAQNTPLQGTIRVVDASSAAPVGDSAGCTGDSLTLSLLESGMFPGGSTTPGQGAINVSLGNTNAGANAAGAGPSTQPNGSGPPPAQNPGPGLPAVATQAATSPTAVHTGEWWSGSLPLLAILAALGGGLIGWPRLRRLPMVARLVTRTSR